MSTAHTRKIMANIRARTSDNSPLVCLTAYSAPIAAALDPHCDILLVGDSVGMVIYGMDNTLGVTLDMMINHGAAVTRSTQNALVVVDMPYGTYEDSPALALQNARRIMDETHCAAVKLEGGRNMAATVKILIDHDIPVMGHIGLQPQSVEKEGGYKIKGKTDESAQKLLDDAKALEDAGVFSMVLEGTVESVSNRVVAAASVPVIGIGASNTCDGQILVTDDMLGMHNDHLPKFVKQYADLKTEISRAVAAYKAEVQSRTFPTADHIYTRPKTTS